MALARSTLAALLLAAALPGGAADQPAPAVHYWLGSGSCPRAESPDSRTGNPCWIFAGAAAGVRVGRVEVGGFYEGREPIDLFGLFLVRPSTVSELGGSVALVGEPWPLWRLSGALEGGGRRYMNFAGHGLGHWSGTATTGFLGATGRLGFGLRPPQGGRADRFELTMAYRKDLRTARAEVDGIPWSISGWSLTVALGLVSDW
jgi:hypothetical protein